MFGWLTDKIYEAFGHNRIDSLMLVGTASSRVDLQMFSSVVWGDSISCGC